MATRKRIATDLSVHLSNANRVKIISVALPLIVLVATAAGARADTACYCGSPYELGGCDQRSHFSDISGFEEVESNANSSDPSDLQVFFKPGSFVPHTSSHLQESEFYFQLHDYATGGGGVATGDWSHDSQGGDSDRGGGQFWNKQTGSSLLDLPLPAKAFTSAGMNTPLIDPDPVPEPKLGLVVLGLALLASRKMNHVRLTL